jgi:hypothetical protein
MSTQAHGGAAPARQVGQPPEFSGKSLAEMAEIAIATLEIQSVNGLVPCGMISGPISTGGLDATETHSSLQRNLRAFEAAIEEMYKRGHNIFSHLPYEDRIVELYTAWHEEHGKDVYFQPVLDEFYKPIFESGFISDLWLLPGWQSSKGAKWEHKYCVRKGIRTHSIEPEHFQYWIKILNI